MLEAHNTGVGLVIVCDLEPAEFYSESLKSKGISSSIEKEINNVNLFLNELISFLIEDELLKIL